MGGDGKTPVVIKPNRPGYGDITVARSTRYHFQDGVTWDYVGRSASIRRFDLTSEY